jgi:hypothetical protein
MVSFTVRGRGGATKRPGLLLQRRARGLGGGGPPPPTSARAGSPFAVHLVPPAPAPPPPPVEACCGSGRLGDSDLEHVALNPGKEQIDIAPT